MDTKGQTIDEDHPDRGMAPTVLVVDDEELSRRKMDLLCKSLVETGELRLLPAASADQAMALLATTPVHLILLDKNLGTGDDGQPENGIEMIPQMLQIQPHVQILVVTGSSDVQNAVDAVKNGALGYMLKDSPDELIRVQIKKALSIARLTLDHIRTTREKPGESGQSLVGTSIAIQAIDNQIPGLAQSSLPALLLGETGTGKTTIAGLIHQCRLRFLKQKERPFLALNLASMPLELVERELFGNEKGAFTGAVATRQGLLELANTGTLFLDEIGEIRPELQAKLLTVLESGEFRRVGGTRVLKSSFKLICATNRKLEEMVSQKTFREDLFMRISTFVMRVPSLRDRKDDIPALIEAILPEVCRNNSVTVQFEEIPEEFIAFLMEDPPPGNIRGLIQQLSRLLVYSRKGKDGRLELRKWRTVPGLMSTSRTTSRASGVTMKTIRQEPFHLLGPSFPGLHALLDLVEDRVVREARTKLSKNKDIANALRLSEAQVSRKLDRMGLRFRGRIAARGKTAESIVSVDHANDDKGETHAEHDSH